MTYCNITYFSILFMYERLFYFSAFVLEDQMWNFVEFKSKYMITQRVPKGFKEAVEAIEDAVKAQPTMVYIIFSLIHIKAFLYFRLLCYF